ncbi:SGNH/GDSL hydrolase family protein [Gracilimonas amylolytica]|uniref:SGNH/GDSL hydrolase family protein n=1 Tax=Gracilimonas amylolytica TaxID=1749045 RepID=UPI000CD90E85|nr:SGNH/GDSL hydrolase family protein [Gracilimonas amylolytica]
MSLNTYFSHKFLSLTLILLVFTACQSKIDSSETDISEPIRYLALGDSYTIGTGINEENNYPNQLTDSLLSKEYQIDTTAVIATNGWTTTDLKNGIRDVGPPSNFDLVTLLIGVNNQYQGLDIDLYQTEFKELLDQAISFARGDTSNVVVISIPNYGVTPFGQSGNPVVIRKEIEMYNSIAEQFASDYGIPFIDVTGISELAGNDSALLASDNLHPSAKMYALWVEDMFPTITEILDE